MSYFDGIYRRESAAYGDEADAFLSEHVVPRPAARALDAGGGSGRNALFLASIGYHVDLVDASQGAVDAANALGAEAGLPILAWREDLRSLHLHRQYELVVAAIVLHAFKSHRAEAVARVLRSAVCETGELYLSVHCSGGREEAQRSAEGQLQIEPSTYVSDGHHKRLFPLDEARALLGWPARVETVSYDERCPREACPYLHDVYRAIGGPSTAAISPNS